MEFEKFKHDKNGVLKRFMKEFFPFSEFRKAGVFTKEMRGDYEAQAKRICEFFGYKTVYEYGAHEVRCHLSDGGRTPFITTVPSIYA